MKSFLILAVILMSLFLDCHNANHSAVNNSEISENTAAASLIPATNSPQTMMKLSDLAYQIEIKVVEDSNHSENARPQRLSVKYTIKNSGQGDYLLYNRGDSDKGFKRNVVYVEPQPDGAVELGQRNYPQPKDKSCPKRDAPLKIGALRLKSGETITEELNIDLPLQYNPLFRDCRPLPQFPKLVKRLKFCLGAVKIDSSKFEVDSQGIIQVAAGNSVNQQMLCSEIIELK